ncbi:LPXTG cell wall anchor domain-containing protein [Streptomyces sp. BBFR2]|uniref:LPXTG cell wall anchor domain-containing protein n=1 Tax=Streptomyces sp. BBFR2 TaxID=3372854 RepID=UPI0037D9F473
MKIRRALTAAAAAAVIGPATVLAAPAASATEPVSGAGPRTTASPSQDGDGAGRPAPGTSPTATPTAGETPAGNDGAGENTGGGEDTGAGGTDQSCAFESDQLEVAVKGLPRELVAGGVWSSFTLTLSNTTGKALEQVQPYLEMASSEQVDRPYWEMETEYHDARTGKWESFHDKSSGEVFGTFALGAHSTRTLELRTHMVKTAKPGAGYAVAAGDFRNGDGSCGSSKETWSDLKLLPAGAKPTQPPTGKPGTPDEPGATAAPGQGAGTGGGTGGGSGSGGGHGPQGGGHLAVTGSSSALPLALAGGAALAAGAGTVLVVRRRKGASAPGAAA